jgi:hypothetical protein
MSALSDYLESGVLNSIFRGVPFTPPSKIAIALTRGVPTQNQNGTTIDEVLPTGVGGVNNGYVRVLVSVSNNNSQKWTYRPENHTNESGVIQNANNVVFNTALADWGTVSGIAILDNEVRGSGNLLFFAELEQPRTVYTGDNVKFNTNELRIMLQ